jgi:hypothetical protein
MSGTLRIAHKNRLFADPESIQDSACITYCITTPELGGLGNWLALTGAAKINADNPVTRIDDSFPPAFALPIAIIIAEHYNRRTFSFYLVMDTQPFAYDVILFIHNLPIHLLTFLLQRAPTASCKKD